MIRTALTESGWVRGLPAADPRVTSYKGIPFAAPPVGKNRWRAPQPCASWTGERPCFDFAPAPMQPPPVIDDANVYTREWQVDPALAASEDCLYLNVWAPAQGQTGLPVLLWCFGGGLQVGYTSEMEFDGERIARRGAVVVTAAYRLNVFGFLCHPELTAEAPDAPANFGFLDQQAALRWVRRNIAAFGGDPHNVTLAGQSAGGMSVAAQLACGANRGLIHRAIIESGLFAPAYPGLSTLAVPLAQAEARGRRFFESLGVRTLAQAREVDAATLLARGFDWGRPWCAAIDGVFLRRDPRLWFLEPERVRCPVLAGGTDAEFRLSPDAQDEEGLRAFAQAHYGPQADRFLSLFTHPATAESIRREGDVGAIDIALALLGRAPRGADEPLYLYRFAADIPGWDHPGAFHSVDLWFFFETLAKCWRPFTGAHYDLARRMCDGWVNFMRTGDPNGMGSDGEPLPEWPAYDPARPRRMRFARDAGAQSAELSPLEAFLLEQVAQQGT